MRDSQKAFSLLLWCCGFGKVVYWARTVPPSQATPTLAEWDTLTRSAFESIAAVRLPDKEWAMNTLSTGSGGFGMRSAVRHAEAAYLASRSLTKTMVEQFVGGDHNINDEVRVAEARSAYNLKVPDVSKHVLSVTDDMEQRTLSKVLDSVTRASLMGSGSEEQRARWSSRAGPYAMAFLHALPCEAFGTAMDPLQFRTAVQYHCGAEILIGLTHCPDCNSFMPPAGNHAVECGVGNGRIQRHNGLCDAFAELARTAGCGPVREKGGIFAHDRSRPADVYLPFFAAGVNVCVDWCVTSPTQTTLVARAANTPLYAAQERVSSKHDRYDRFLPNGTRLVVAAVETYGAWHMEGVGLVREVAKLAAKRSGTLWPDEFRRFVQLAGVLLQRHNAIMILRKVAE